MFGLPEETRACLFDMDGVVTKTAVVHAAELLSQNGQGAR